LFALSVWGIGGLIALTGSLTFSELGSMFPSAGGVYVYLKNSFGDKTAFLYGWITLLVVNTGALAALSLAFANYLTFFIDLSEMQKIMIAISTILVLTYINVRGIGVSQSLSNVFTGLKLLALFAIIVLGAFIFGDSSKVFQADSGFIPIDHPQAFLTGLIGVLWSFGGWHHASYLSGEAINAQKTVPRAMVLGTLIVTLVYILANFAYFSLLNIPEFAASERVAGDAMSQIFSRGGQMVSLAIMVSVFGTIGIYTMSAPRIYYAMAKDKIFFTTLAQLHPKYHTPHIAMWFQAIWACLLLLLWRTFTDLITYTTFMDIAFMALAGVAIFVLRKKSPNAERLIKVPFYPVVPLIFVVISGAFVINTLIERPQQAVAGVLILGIGFLAYIYFERKNKRTQIGKN
jgi:APA family basic amino acid/polyamine antiporter